MSSAGWMAMALAHGLAGARAQHALPPPLDASSFVLPPAPDGRAEAGNALRRAALPAGWRAAVWAAEPQVMHPVAFDLTGDGRVFVAESLRAWRGVPDIRNLLPWLDDDLAARTVDDRLALMRRLWGEEGLKLHALQSEQVRVLSDSDGDGRADHSRVFATGFNTPLDGVASSVLVRGNEAWFANIPDIWRLSDRDGDGVADARRSLSHGHGVRISMLGHDLHGLVWGPDGRIYVSVGDRASMILHDGRWIGHPECGAVFRFEPDGSGLELFALGLRNPQELVFDDWGNLFTGDNSANTGDESRWVHVVAGGDSGWRIGWQWAENRGAIADGVWRMGTEGPGATAPWITEGIWRLAHPGQPAYMVPPVANFAAGPGGTCRYPGTGLDTGWEGQFLLTDFRGSSNDSRLWRFRVVADGAGFRVVDLSEWLRGVNATDVAFGPAGAVWLLDWGDGWVPASRGRIHVLTPPSGPERTSGAETAALLKAGVESLAEARLVALLSHADQRVRQEAQFALAGRGASSLPPLLEALAPSAPLPVRRHAAWALGQIARQARRAGGLDPSVALDPLIPLLSDPSLELRAVVASVLGDLRHAPAREPLQAALARAHPVVLREAALALGRIGVPESLDSLVAAAGSGAAADPILRHALVMGVLGCGDAPALLRIGGDADPGVRLVAVVALRRLERPELARFLDDPDPAVRAEAARAIHDLPIAAALPDLVGVSDGRLLEAPFSRRVVNACLRVGSRESARRLGEIAADERLPEAIRSDALVALAAWPGTSGRDRVTGLWRPLVFQRTVSDALDALRPGLDRLLASPAPSLVSDAAVAAAALRIREVAPTLAMLARDTRRPAGVRTAALQALATLEDPALPQTLDPLFADGDPAVRSLALRLAARANGPGALALLQRVLDTGSDSDRQAAFAGLARLEHPEVVPLLGRWLERLLAGTVPAAVQLDLLEAAAARSDPGLDDQRRRFREAGGADPLAAYSTSLEGGSAAAGEAVFQSAEVQCIRCHRLWDRGGEVGPDLSAIGRQLDRRTLLESVVTPDSRLATGYETVLVTLDDGEVHAGIAARETAGTLTLRLADGSTVAVETAKIRSRDRGASAMPSGLAEILGPRRLRDLIEYLASLK